MIRSSKNKPNRAGNDRDGSFQSWKCLTLFLPRSHLSHHDEADADVDHWAVRFGFDISPMVARVTNKNATRWYDFITNLLAILGGAFTVVQLLERTTSVVF